MSAKIAKTIARQKEKIAEGQFYEAHQQLRVITARYLKAEDFTSAADVLSNGSLLLLRAGQGGSGGDLAITLLNDVYIKGEYEVTSAHKSTVLEILHAFPRQEPTRKRFISDMISWSSKFGELPDRGDAELHHAAGVLLAQEGEAYEAEKHLVLGVPASAAPLATMHYTWYSEDSPHTAGLYASRAVLAYLILGNLQCATTALATFTSQLTTHHPQIPTQSIDGAKSSVRLFPSLPLLNFLSLLLLAAQRGDSALFKSLARQYAPHLKEVEDIWADAMTQIGEIWFGIRIPRQGGNPLFDMMGSMLFGGGGQKPSTPAAAAAAAGSATPKQKALEKPPVAMDLD